MKFEINVEEVPEEIDAKNYEEAREKVNDCIDIHKAEYGCEDCQDGEDLVMGAKCSKCGEIGL